MREKIVLDLKERLNYVYQLRILEKLYPEESAYYAQYRTALESGFELHYQDMFEELNEDELSMEASQEVLDILEMYRGIIFSYQALKQKSSTMLTEDRVKFPGFDGNEESRLMAYVIYFINTLGRYSEIQSLSHGYYNSHAPMLKTYQNMLRKWKSSNAMGEYTMTEEEILRLLDV